MSNTRRARPLASAAGRPRGVRPAVADRRIVEGRITEVLPDGRAKLVTHAGPALPMEPAVPITAGYAVPLERGDYAPGFTFTKTIAAGSWIRRRSGRGSPKH